MEGFGSLIMGLSSASTAYNQAQAAKAQGRYQKRISETNARLADERAADAVKRGGEQSNQVRRQANKVDAEQRAAAAAQGLDAGSGDFSDLRQETATTAALDESRIKTNAWREAFGYKVEALNASSQGEFAELSAENQAGNTILTGGMQALSYGLDGYAKIKKDQVNPSDKDFYSKTGKIGGMA
jgi:hypothetical protein